MPERARRGYLWFIAHNIDQKFGLGFDQILLPHKIVNPPPSTL